MTGQEITRVILGLRRKGWTEKDINDFLLYIENGDETLFLTNETEQDEQEH